MKYITSLTFLALATLSQASISRPRQHARLQKRVPEDVDACGESSFVGGTTTGSPLVADCLNLIATIDEDSWERSENAVQITIQEQDSCAFGIEGATSDQAGTFVVGNTDVADLINTAIEMFSWTDEDGNERVGASGDMMCNGAFAQSAEVTWGLYSRPE